MKFFTADLIEKLNSRDDDVALPAHDEWERAIVRSDRRWKKIKQFFPKEVQRFDEESVCLHDAYVLGMGQVGNRFLFILQLEPPSRALVILTFTLDGGPVIDEQALADHPAIDRPLWMYEEFDIDRQKKLTFSVLLTNGWEVKLRFRDFQYLIAQPVLTPVNGQVVAASGKAAPQTA